MYFTLEYDFSFLFVKFSDSTETFKFNIHGSVQRNNILVYKSQQDAHVTEFILSYKQIKQAQQSGTTKYADSNLHIHGSVHHQS
jgi:hypothetical protein